MNIQLQLYAIFTKGKKFCDCLLATLDDNILLNGEYCLSIKFAPQTKRKT